MQYRNAAVPTGPVVVTFNGRVFGLEPETGAVRWEHRLEGWRSTARLAITEQHVVIATHTDVHCFDYQTGEEYWKVKRVHSGAASVLVVNERVVVASNGEVECVTMTGEPLWSNGFAGKGYGALAMGVPYSVIQADNDT